MSNNLFDENDVLFHALREIHVKDNRTVLPDAIRLPSFSCNWERYRDFPEAVLAAPKSDSEGYLHVGRLVVGDLPLPFSADGKVYWEVSPAHDPIESNFSHSEIRLRRQGEEYDPDTKPSSPKLKAEIRSSIAGKMRLIPRYSPRG